MALSSAVTATKYLPSAETTRSGMLVQACFALFVVGAGVSAVWSSEDDIFLRFSGRAWPSDVDVALASGSELGSTFLGQTSKR